MTPTRAFQTLGLEPFPEIGRGDDLAAAIIAVLAATGTELHEHDIVVVASKAVSISEDRHVDLDHVVVGEQARELSATTGKPAPIVQLILDHSTSHHLATERGPIIAWHHLGHQLTSAGIDRDGTDGAWLLPEDPDASARALRDALTAHTGRTLAVVIADSDGRPDRRGATVLALGAAGIAPLRVSEHAGKRQEETFLDLIAGAAGIILGQRGRGAPVAILRGVAYEQGDQGVAAVLHRRP